MKLRMPTKFGYKNPKHIATTFVSNKFLGRYWEDKGYNFGGNWNSTLLKLLNCLNWWNHWVVILLRLL